MLTQPFILRASNCYFGGIKLGSGLKNTHFYSQVYLQCGLSRAPVFRRILAMGTLLVMMAISRGVNPSLLGVLRSSSSGVYWYSRICTASMSCCSTASNMASLPWKFWKEQSIGAQFYGPTCLCGLAVFSFRDCFRDYIQLISGRSTIY